MDKSKVTQDELFAYLTQHDFVIALLGKMMGVSNGILMGCFHHNLNRHGRPLKFSAANIEKLNAALEQIANELRGSILVFDPNAKPNQRGAIYDPTLVQPIIALGKYFKLTPMLFRLFKWKEGKKSAVLCQPSSKVYGNISKDVMTAINAEILSVAGVLSSYEVVPDDTQPINNNKGTRTDNGIAGQKESEPWEDTALDLWERYAAFHRLFPDGLIAFTVNDGFTVCEDDARLLARVDTTLQPYTDPTTGHVTLYMDADKWRQMRRAWDDGDEMVAESPMYPAE